MKKELIFTILISIILISGAGCSIENIEHPRNELTGNWILDNFNYAHLRLKFVDDENGYFLDSTPFTYRIIDENKIEITDINKGTIEVYEYQIVGDNLTLNGMLYFRE